MWRHLTELGLGTIEYEPEGRSKAPDFLVDNRIAVEARILNQHEPACLAVKPQGLERVAIPMLKKIEDLLPTLGGPTRENSWFVFIDFRRPLPPWKKIEVALTCTGETEPN